MHETIATLATIPSRRDAVVKTLLSLHGQVDSIHLAFDSPAAGQTAGDATGESAVYDAFDTEAWRACPLHAIHTSHGDLAKLLAVEWTRESTQDDGADTALLVCDDDLEYPADYAAWMVRALRAAEAREGRPVLVSLHGATLPPTLKSYRRDRVMVQHCLAPRAFAGDAGPRWALHPAHVLGTGVLVARRHLLTRFLDDTAEADLPRNALDLNLAVWAEQARIPRFVVLQPRPNWLHYLLPKDAPTIWSAQEVVKEDAIVSAIEWRPL